MGNKNNYESREEIKDAMWKNAESSNDIFGEIVFRKNNKKNYFKSFLKVVSFILIAALSGGITAQYEISKDNAPKDVSGVLNPSSQGNNIQGIPVKSYFSSYSKGSTSSSWNK